MMLEPEEQQQEVARSGWWQVWWLGVALAAAVGPFAAIEVLYQQGMPLKRALELVGAVVMVLWPVVVYVAAMVIWLQVRELRRGWWEL